MSDKNDEKGFKVDDRRWKNNDENSQESPEEISQEQSQKSAPEESEKPVPEPDLSTNPEDDMEGQVPETAGENITFATFVLSLAANVNIHLGLVPNPINNENEVQLPLASQTIDIINMLEQKTQGNLDKDEEQLLKHVLYDLRMKYVQVTQEQA